MRAPGGEKKKGFQNARHLMPGGMNEGFSAPKDRNAPFQDREVRQVWFCPSGKKVSSDSTFSVPQFGASPQASQGVL